MARAPRVRNVPNENVDGVGQIVRRARIPRKKKTGPYAQAQFDVEVAKQHHETVKQILAEAHEIKHRLFIDRFLSTLFIKIDLL